MVGPLSSAGPQPPSLEAARAIVRSLIDSGVSRFVYAPGSRNAPFAYVLAAYEDAGLIQVHKFVEERGAAFFAVGAMLAEETPQPTAVFTTSGTAVAEMYPAALEASHQMLPLVLVTADRPFEVLGAGASQTTNQTGIYGSFVVAQVSIPAAQTADGAFTEGVAAQVGRLVARAKGWGANAGPAHLNVHFREPIVPAAPLTVGHRPRTHANASEKKHPRPRFVAQSPSPVPFLDAVDETLRTLVIAGDGALRRTASFGYEGDQVKTLAEGLAQAKVPMVAEPSSGLTPLSNWVPHGPWVLDALAPEVQQVIVIGRPTLTRQVSGLLADPSVRKVVVSPHEQWPDPAGTADTVVSYLAPPTAQFGPETWLERWQDASSTVNQILVEDRGFDHLSVAAEIWRSPQDVDLWLGPSNPIRMFDIAAGAPGRSAVFSNRGLSGIDGAIAQALGAQLSTGRPTRAVVGDLTFLYDLPSLAARPAPAQDLQIVVFDDGGGSIFATLEHGRTASRAVLSDYFELPPDVDFLRVAAGCGWKTETVTSLRQLRAVVAQVPSGLSVLRVPLDGPADRMAQLRAECAAAAARVESTSRDTT